MAKLNQEYPNTFTLVVCKINNSIGVIISRIVMKRVSLKKIRFPKTTVNPTKLKINTNHSEISKNNIDSPPSLLVYNRFLKTHNIFKCIIYDTYHF